MNGLTKKDVIYPGQKLRLPSSCVEQQVVSQESPAPSIPAKSAPKLERKISSEEEFSDSSDLAVLLLGDFSILQGKDVSNGTHGKLLTKLNTGVKVVWAQNWDEDIRTDLFLKLKSFSFYAEAHGDELHKDKITTTSFGMSFYKKLTHRFEIGASLEQAELPFYRGYLLGSRF